MRSDGKRRVHAGNSLEQTISWMAGVQERTVCWLMSREARESEPAVDQASGMSISGKLKFAEILKKPLLPRPHHGVESGRH